MKLSQEEKVDLVKLSRKVKSNTIKSQLIKLGNGYFRIKELG